MKVRPWTGTILPPTDPDTPNFSAPQAMMQLKWIHGYRSQDVRQNLYYTKDGDIVYPASSFGVVYNSGKHTQKYVEGRDGSVCVCVCVCVK
jgi:microtubule-associated protein-like 6